MKAYVSQSSLSDGIHALDTPLFIRRPNKKIKLTMCGGGVLLLRVRGMRLDGKCDRMLSAGNLGNGGESVQNK